MKNILTKQLRVPLWIPIPTFILGQVIFYSFDFLLRLIANGRFHFEKFSDLPKDGKNTSLLDAIAFFLLLIVLIIPIYLLWKSSSNVKNIYLKILYILLSATLGFLIFAFAGIWYVCYTGIDCF